MAAATVVSLSVVNSTTLKGAVVFSSVDVASSSFGTNAQEHTVTVSGIDFSNDTANTIQGKVAAAVRALTASLANGSGGTGFTVGANQVLMPGWAKG